jgi:hypothetical protein
VQAVLMMPVPPRKRTFMVDQVLFLITVRSRRHYSIGIIAVLKKRERTFEIGQLQVRAACAHQSNFTCRAKKDILR